MDHGRYDYSPIATREPLQFPNGARIAIWIVPNIEHFAFDSPSTSIADVTANLVPDVLNYAWRDYGVRVGVLANDRSDGAKRHSRHRRPEFRRLPSLSANHRSNSRTRLGAHGPR